MPVNERALRLDSISEIVARFSTPQRDWYKRLLVEVVPFFGYELMHE
ncbi:MAG TPA: hypothetical protein VKT81_13620 [Bryobacteraceae bacterium]|nr:hypothetical protein [Bryobacteraceae bacterium]